MDRNLRTGRRDGRYAGDFSRNFVSNEIHLTTDEPAGTNRSDIRYGGDAIAEFTDGSWSEETDPNEESGNSINILGWLLTGANHNGTGNEYAEFGHIFGTHEMGIGDLNITGGSSPLNRGSIQYDPGVERRNYALSPVFRVQHFLHQKTRWSPTSTSTAATDIPGIKD